MSNLIYYVYFHICEKTNNIIYIGKGKNKRAYDIKSRNSKWKEYTNLNGFSVELHKENLSEENAYALENKLIAEHKKDGFLLNIVGVTKPVQNINFSRKKKVVTKKKRIVTKKKKAKYVEPTTLSWFEPEPEPYVAPINNNESQGATKQDHFLYATGRMNPYQYYKKRR